MNPILQMLGINNVNNITPQQAMFMQMLCGSGPKQALNTLMQQHPELQSLGSNPTEKDLEQMCRNLCGMRGLDYNNVYKQAQQLAQQFNLK